MQEVERIIGHLTEKMPCNRCANSFSCIKYCDEWIKWYKLCMRKLAEYEAAEEEGRLLFLPCNPGITLYVLRKKYTRCSKHNEEFDESICCGCEDECDSRLFYYILPCPDATAEQILEYERRGALNKTVFFNLEKAEKKLEELNGV